VNIDLYLRAGANLTCTASSMDHIFQASSGLNDIKFSSIREWRLEGDIDLFGSLNFSAASSIMFLHTSYPMKGLFPPIPNHLTKLELICVTFTLESLPSGQRHFLPCLNTLSFEDVIFTDLIRKFFHCPKLRNLRHSISFDEEDNDTTTEGHDSRYKAAIRDHLDETFFEETPVLVSISIQGITLDDDLRSTIASCPVLHSLEITDCGIRKFIQPFLENLQDTKYFPSLERLCIDDSWPANFNMSCDEFAAHCRSKRPGIYFSGNGRWDAETFSDHAQSESDLGSDSEADSDELGDGDSDPGHG
jgi:hypothetical protein